MLRSLPYCYSSREDADEWYYDFLAALLTHGETRFLPRYIDPDYETNMAEHRARRDWESHRELKQLQELRLDESKILNEGAPPPKRIRDPEEYKHFRQSFNWMDADEVQVQPYNMRAYQNELVGHANRGKNAIVCAPTGKRDEFKKSLQI